MTQSTVSSLEALLASLDVHNKTAVTHPNPPTSGPGSGVPDTLTEPTEGQRMSEHKANIRDMVGPASAENAPSPDTNVGELNLPSNAAVVAPTGGDSAGSSSRTGAPVEAEPGTSNSNLKISQQLQHWQDSATELLVTLMQTETKQAFEAATAKIAGTKPADAKPADAKVAADNTVPPPGDDFYAQVSAGDAALAAQAREMVHAQLVAAHAHGTKLAHATLAYLNELNAERTKLAEGGEGGEEKGKDSSASEGGSDSGSSEPSTPAPAASAPPPAAAPAPAAPDDAAGGVTEEDIAQAVEIMAQQTGQSPDAVVAQIVAELEGGDMGGGMGGDMGGGMGGEEDPALVDEALVELASEMGMQPEELEQMLAAEESAGGMPPAAAGGAPAGMPADPTKTSARRLQSVIAASRGTKLSAAQQNVHRARRKIAVKRRALEVLTEQLQRGAR